MADAFKDFLQTAWLGQPVIESDPWESKIIDRKVVGITTHESWDQVLCRSNPPRRSVMVSGGFMGLSDVTAEKFGTRYFLDREEALKACVEQSVQLKAERRLQLEAEIERARKELEASNG